VEIEIVSEDHKPLTAIVHLCKANKARGTCSVTARRSYTSAALAKRCPGIHTDLTAVWVIFYRFTLTKRRTEDLAAGSIVLLVILKERLSFVRRFFRAFSSGRRGTACGG
jgi:hypothetical protein